MAYYKTTAELIDKIKSSPEFKLLQADLKIKLLNTIQNETKGMSLGQFEQYQAKLIDTPSGAHQQRDGFVEPRELDAFLLSYANALRQDKPTPAMQHVELSLPSDLIPKQQQTSELASNRALDGYGEAEVQRYIRNIPKPVPGENKEPVHLRSVVYFAMLSGGEQALNPENAQQLYQAMREQPALLNQFVADLELNQTANQQLELNLGETAQQIAMRVIFGGGAAGFTNFNCMPIVKLHGELAELGGEIQGSSRDLKSKYDEGYSKLSLTQQDKSMATLMDLLDAKLEPNYTVTPRMTPPGVS